MIDWKENGTPVSREFDDIYFSPENGLEETKHVFLKGNRLEERLSSSGARHVFSILELGFGTGLNFFASWQLWRDCKSKSGFRVLRFTSFEKYPLERDDIRKAISAFPELSELLELFLEKYKLLVPGCNTFLFEKENLILDLWIGDAIQLLPEVSGKFDAFFLDGFAPSKNPELWGENISLQLKRLSDQNASFATFTVARSVKDRLSEAGFTLSKIPGFGRKREMLIGVYESEPEQDLNPIPFLRRTHSDKVPEKVSVLGAGLAGAGIARALAWRGIHVEVWDDHNALRASSVPMAVSHPHITKVGTPTSLWTLRCLGNSIRRYSDLLSKDSYQISGTLQLSGEDLPWARLEEGIKAHSLSSDLAELKPELGESYPDNAKGIFYPSGFWTDTPLLVEKLLDHPNILLKQGKASSIAFEKEEWTLFSENNEILNKTEVLILANSFGIENLLQGLWKESPFSPRSVRGQLEILEDPNIESEKDPIRVGDKYLTPSKNGIRVNGSTFDEFDLNPNASPKDREEILEYSQRTYLGLNWKQIKVRSDFVGIRSQTPDRFPIVGPVHSPGPFRKIYSGMGLHKNRKKEFPFLEPQKNLFVFGGLGSRGVLTSLLGGEILAEILLNEPLSIENSLYSSLHPSRFLYRKIRNQE
ncbi:bifunctional tRNA (5-methylaminomethyl-2-thiouridine)(34)-methyltransferase MnmD/FAD-dependent 5-carboxymethylaminomethyl-2-thiouridine(34) oxidoreductase MnmC [Leptospira hartskeerlii]|uniref:tRNA 5-methylaminomethyl-2-thiouridine biosynthesis bifunctional protein MnmC n=1 Tax=Leptospira hartskeerlii TaxID=2023177 RepID=A0A2M9XGC0_9LEPT|nr:bifunctional tRNA (5-methylaminomethyl-2-thiouridine)(34)-methyltransferase MnmD/FAD-dependent 5-carboxymethylaminomethyl-2-thiouridine(34) oxidoreductase MnmC [Leptospira hartskeerlii]PJZ26720.1 bifunctional tRNA (5-methylaminomethyl-2-thiouridine)(34)-methyltransferase MnmD/FAD-dependent 5-carboxymethylaminomethyl-2-thiouridine(34) oxidoreductase MnmC [Leptospira hartskeerlii]PJZ34798.1 bifunctional tRNA (5-methylaminomethyl-2-thiouridine)(34)-methyltransferase MnmD/FAD-dependent 5-carboxyme